LTTEASTTAVATAPPSTTTTTTTTVLEDVGYAAARVLAMGSVVASRTANATGAGAQAVGSALGAGASSASRAVSASGIQELLAKSFGSAGASAGALVGEHPALSAAALCGLCAVGLLALLSPRGGGRGRKSTRSAQVASGEYFGPCSPVSPCSPGNSPSQGLLLLEASHQGRWLEATSPRKRSTSASSPEAEETLRRLQPRGLLGLRDLLAGGTSPSVPESPYGAPPRPAWRGAQAPRSVSGTVTVTPRWDLARVWSWFSRPPRSSVSPGSVSPSQLRAESHAGSVAMSVGRPPSIGGGSAGGPGVPPQALAQWANARLAASPPGSWSAVAQSPPASPRRPSGRWQSHYGHWQPQFAHTPASRTSVYGA
jgi:hypothetical protein